MLDALRRDKTPRRDKGQAPRSRASEHNVPASLAYPGDRSSSDGDTPPARRLALALALVAVTALLVWQVVAMNGLLPFGPFSWLVRPVPARSARAANVAKPAPPRATAAAATNAPSVTPGLAARPAPEGIPTRVPPPSGTPAAPIPAQVPTPVRPSRTEPVQPKAAAPAGRASAPAAPGATAGEADHFKLALYYQRLGDFENALIHYRAVIAADELNAEAHNNLGVLYQSKGLFDEAIREFQRATFIDPGYVKAHNNLGVALLRSGNTDAAASEFRSIVSQDAKNVEGLTNLALALKAGGRSEEAKETLLRVLTINPRYTQAHYNLALLYEERGELQRAIDHFEQFLATAGSEGAGLAAEVRQRVQALRARLQ